LYKKRICKRANGAFGGKAHFARETFFFIKIIFFFFIETVFAEQTFVFS